jgi:hypothetical protein
MTVLGAAATYRIGVGNGGFQEVAIWVSMADNGAKPPLRESVPHLGFLKQAPER